MFKSALVTALLVGLTSPAIAQTALDQNLNGIVRGIESQNTSAQVGEVLFDSSGLVVDMKGTGGKAEAVTINRGFQCSDQPGPVAATASISRDRLLSGNYLVVVHNNGANSRAVACGQLYR
jgi:hypothetical protein